MSAAMAVNHTTAADVTPAKRKHTGDNSDGPVSSSTQQNDILEVLRQHDFAQSFLEYEFKQTSEHPTKRAKLSGSAAVTSIAARLARSAYDNLRLLLSDAVLVSEALIQRARDEVEPGSDQSAMTALKKVQRAHLMLRTIEDLVERESKADHEASVKKEEAASIKTEATEEAGTVLTLFGNAPGPKQLFSSFQNATTTSDGRAVKPALALEELSLPNGLTTTKIKPLASIAVEKPSTFAESFPPAFSLPALSAPKPARRPSTRDKTVLWEFKDNTRGVKRGGLTTQPQSTADWLSYGGISSRDKRKMRDRALSDGQSSVDGEDLAIELQKQEEALFRQAYSSFAPAYDNSRSVVDVTLKNLVWWHKVGSRKYSARFNLDPALHENDNQPPAIKDDVFDDSGFAQAVEDYVEEEELEEGSTDLTDPDEVLNKITRLLQTLASMQIIRNSKPQAQTFGKPAISPAPPSSAGPVQPDVPSKDEVDTYEQLQREIAYLVLQLPPYAVAKLNGSQLADLGVSKVITFETKAYRGQMEEDAAARLARQTAAATAAGVASLNRASSSTNPHYSNRTPAIGQSASTRYGVNTGYGSRTPATAPVQQQRPGSQQNYGTPTGAPRQYTPGATQYARQGAPTSYTQTNGQYRPTTNYGYNATPASQRPVQPAAQPFQRSQMAAANAVSYQTQYQASPKPLAPDAGRSTPAGGQTPVNGIRATPPILARAASGTPQPDVNGHP